MSGLTVRAGVLSRKHELNLARGKKVDIVSLIAMRDELRSLDIHTDIEKKYLEVFQDYLDVYYMRAILSSKENEDE